MIDRLRKALTPHYTVDRPLGSGGMGEVFLGQDAVLKRPVAIKVLRTDLASTELAARFLREAQTLAKLNHPNVVPIYLVDEREGLSFYIMQHVGQGTLADHLRQGPLDESEVRTLGRNILAGLGAAHQTGIVHRDIKPSNILLAAGGAVLGDFGIARSAREATTVTTLTAPGQAIGTPAYMSPEQSLGLEVDGRSDLYSLGLVLYEAVTGRRWRTNLSAPGLDDWSGISKRLARVIRKAVALSPDGRWQTAEAFSGALASLEEPILSWRGGAVAATVAMLIILFWPRPEPEIPCRPPGASDLAFLPFAVGGGTPVIDGANVSQLIKSELEWFGRIRLTSDLAVSCWIDSVPAGRRDNAAVRGLAARRVVSGLVLHQSSGWVLRLTVRDSEPEPAYVLAVPGDPDDVFAWARAAADSVVRRVFPHLWVYYSELRARTNPNSNRQAYAAFFDGEREFQRDAYNYARNHYEAALAQDSTLLFAAWRLGIVYRFLRVPFEEHLRKLYEQHSAELPEQYREVIVALLDPDLRRRFDRYRAIVGQFPRDGYLRFVYADELFHRGPLVGIPLDSALAQFREAAAIDRDLDQLPAYDHLLIGYIRLGRKPEADSALRDRMRLPLSGELQERQRRRFLQFAYDSRFRPWRAKVATWWFSHFVDASTLVNINRYARLGTSIDIPSTQAALGRILTERGHDSATIANGYRAQGLALTMEGRPARALFDLDTAAILAGKPDGLLERAEWRVILPALGMPGIPDSEREWGLSHLRDLAGREGVGARATWALAVAAYSRGDSAAGRELAAGLVSRDSRNLRVLLDALHAGAAGRTADALGRTDSLIGYAASSLVRDPFARAVLYQARSRWQMEVGDTAASRATRLWYLNSDSGIDGWPQHDLEAGEVDVLLGVMLRLVRADEERTQGDIAVACNLAGRVRELWSEAEPDFEGFRSRADSLVVGCRQ